MSKRCKSKKILMMNYIPPFIGKDVNFFSNKIINKEFKLKKKFDLIYSRQVLEHIPNLNNFLKLLLQ